MSRSVVVVLLLTLLVFCSARSSIVTAAGVTVECTSTLQRVAEELNSRARSGPNLQEAGPNTYDFSQSSTHAGQECSLVIGQFAQRTGFAVRAKIYSFFRDGTASIPKIQIGRIKT